MKYCMFLFLLISSIARAEYFEKPGDIEKYTSTFKTFNGQGLTKLLAIYGLRIESISTTPIEKLGKFTRKPGDRDGDIVASLFITGQVKKMPCGLHKWLTQGYAAGHAEDMSEVINRKGAWVADNPEVNPLLYWAATNKCSSEYGLPM